MSRTLMTAVMAVAVFAVASAQSAFAESSAAGPAPTIVLVHGAWEQGASWDAVAARLRARGDRVVVPEFALRSLAEDAARLAAVLQSVEGPIVLVGHSYGGSVISAAGASNGRVKALVFIAGFAPDRGESTFGLDARVPGSLLPASIVPVPFVQAGGGVAVYVNPLLYRTTLAQDLPEPAAAAMADAQRPITLAALVEPSPAPAWKTIASWYMVASDDRAIPPSTERFMAHRAKAHTVEFVASHVAHVSLPEAVTNLIVTAAGSASPPAAPAVAAAVTGLRVSPGTFRAARSGPAVKAGSARTPTRVSYTLDNPASVRFTVQRSSRGRSVGGRCVRPKTNNRGRSSCTRFVAVPGGFTRDRPAGADSFAFTARVGGRTLRPSRYRLVATPIANGRRGSAASARFRVVR